MALSQRGQAIQTDLLVIGSGIAGLSFCLSAAKRYPNKQIALISKTALQESNSYYAQGGIAAVSHPDDSIATHIDDTLRAGGGLCLEQAVTSVIEKAPEAIAFLIEQGAKFDTVDEGYDLTREGGHTNRRIYHTGDHTGRTIIGALVPAIKACANITLYEDHTAVNLITQNELHVPGQQGEVIGAYILEEANDKIHSFFASSTVLATGGAGKVYRYTTNPEVATGDGIAMAFRAGARVGNMEFYQFHPTLLHHHMKNNLLISEAMRGEGAYLRLPTTGERFMERYAPEQMELATRDIVARAIFTEIERNDFNHVNLDIRHQPIAFLKKHFPYLTQTLATLDIDISQSMIPVVPAAHYLCGGILTDMSGQSDLSRLYAIGETAFTGLHGANRLASNSLIEGVVMGMNAAKACESQLDSPAHNHAPLWDSESVRDTRRASQINAHWRGLRGEMTSYAGIVRTEAGLKDMLRLIRSRSEAISAYYWKHLITRDVVELRNIVLIAELIVRSALKRRESRGGHYREDFPTQAAQATETLLREGLD